MNKRNFLLTSAFVFSIGGLYYFGVAVSYWYGYLADTASTVRNEYMGGVLLALMLAIPFWLLVSALSYPIRNQIKRVIYIGLNVPTILLCSGFVLGLIYVAFNVLIGSET